MRVFGSFDVFHLLFSPGASDSNYASSRTPARPKANARRAHVPSRPGNIFSLRFHFYKNITIISHFLFHFLLQNTMFTLVQVRFPIFFFWEQHLFLMHTSNFFPLCPKISEYFYFHSQMFSKRMFPVVWVTFLPFTFTFQKRIKSFFPGHISRPGWQGDWDAVGH